jgi:GNAT superfamily N-acetyltransferase
MEHNTPLTMIRPTLESLPEHPLPAGFGLRRYRPGDMDHWLLIHRLADRYNEVSASMFRAQFGDDDRLLAERQWYLIDESGTAVGTATAWLDEHFQGGRWGRVHWVAIVPALQGRGLAKPLLSAVCRRLRELGHERAYLTTSAARLPAINLYLQFGFRPLALDAADQECWADVLARLGRPELP